MDAVTIPDSGKFKFILTKCGKRYFVFGDFLPYHSDLFDKFLQLNPGEVEIIGGGRMTIQDNKIKIYGKSNVYGSFDRKIVRVLMEKYCKQKNLKLEID